MTSRSGGVLLVEDDGLMAIVLTSVLQRFGYRCREATSEGEALAAISRSPPWLVVLDTRDEWPVAWSLRRAFGDLPIVVATDAPHLAPGGYDLVAKRYTVGQLLRAVERHVPVLPRAA